MKKSDLVITILGLCLITSISIILTILLSTEKYGNSIVYFDIIAITLWLIFMIIRTLKKN